MKNLIAVITTFSLALALVALNSYRTGYEAGKSEAEIIEKEVIKYIEVEKDSSEPTEPIIESLGIFTATAYCCENYAHICNDGNALHTATGTVPTVGRTIAVDPTVIPYGTQVIINGHTYTAEDTGGAIKGKKVDILFATHAEAMAFGVQKVEVLVVK